MLLLFDVVVEGIFAVSIVAVLLLGVQVLPDLWLRVVHGVFQLFQHVFVEPNNLVVILTEVVRFVRLLVLFLVILVAEHLLFELLLRRRTQSESGHVTDRTVLGISSAPTVKSLNRLGLRR